MAMPAAGNGFLGEESILPVLEWMAFVALWALLLWEPTAKVVERLRRRPR